ncbi:hypothetical protein [Methyloversatilis sp.]|uniref:hypothetical protein n=1 Tax=Methyloversatilis sp. TaxID=2569862 RepID=UPI0035B420BC
MIVRLTLFFLIAFVCYGTFYSLWFNTNYFSKERLKKIGGRLLIALLAVASAAASIQIIALFERIFL